MNKIYKVIFSRRLGAFVVASELTKAHSKDSNSSCVDEHRGFAGAQRTLTTSQCPILPTKLTTITSSACHVFAHGWRIRLDDIRLGAADTFE